MWFSTWFQIVVHGIGAALPRLETPQGKSKESVMNLKTILVSLVLGSSSIALAAPAAPAPVAQPNAIYHPDAQGWRGIPSPPIYRSVTLASDMRLGFNGRASIAVGGQAGRFNTLRLSAAAGKTFIKQVIVQFNNGQSQVVGLGKMLDGHDTLTIDLAGNQRGIRQIVVTGNELSNGRRRPYGAFNVTAS
jgi:hypothetical protein